MADMWTWETHHHIMLVNICVAPDKFVNLSLGLNFLLCKMDTVTLSVFWEHAKHGRLCIIYHAAYTLQNNAFWRASIGQGTSKVIISVDSFNGKSYFMGVDPC